MVGWFLDLKTAGKIPAHYSACAPSGQGPKQRVLSRFFADLNAGKFSLRCQVVETGAIARFGQG